MDPAKARRIADLDDSIKRIVASQAIEGFVMSEREVAELRARLMAKEGLA